MVIFISGDTECSSEDDEPPDDLISGTVTPKLEDLVEEASVPVSKSQEEYSDETVQLPVYLQPDFRPKAELESVRSYLSAPEYVPNLIKKWIEADMFALSGLSFDSFQ